MARRVRDINLESRAGRAKLPPCGNPYYRLLAKGLHIGYRKGVRGGVWVVRRNLPSGYVAETIGTADDVADADGMSVFNFWQARERAWAVSKALRPGGNYKVRDAVADYLDQKLKGRASYNDTRGRLEAYALPALGDRLVDKLTAEELRKWHRALADAPKRVRGGTRDVNGGDTDALRRRQVSANRILGQLKAALNFAFENSKAASDSEWRRVKPFKDVNQSRASYLTLAQCKRLINAADPEFRLLVRAALETGARYSHITRLRVGDFNPDSGTLHVRPQSRPGKQGKGFHIVLTDDGREFFSDLVAGRASGEPILRREWKASQQQRPMKVACSRAKIEPPVGFNQLRHTWASHAVMGGMPLPVVAKNLGHTDTRMVERHYGHLAPSYVAETVRKHAPKFGKTPSNVRAL
jgi:integrase